MILNDRAQSCVWFNKMILTGWSGRSFCSMSHKDSPQVVEKETQSKSELVVCRYTRQSAILVEPVEVCKSNVHLPGFPLSWSPVATGSAKKKNPNQTTQHHSQLIITQLQFQLHHLLRLFCSALPVPSHTAFLRSPLLVH